MTDTTDIEIFSTDELLSLPPASWLIDGIVPEDGRIGLYGAPSSGKSFLALDWAMHISEGMPWLGHKTKQGPVIYIAAEGGRGIQKRVRAWMHYHSRHTLPAMYWLLEPLYVRDEGVVEAFVDRLEVLDIYPRLIVLDTLSRSMGNGDENGPDMAYFVDRVIHLASARTMAALVVHHSNATGSRERGHSALRANLDAMFSCKAERNGDSRIVRIAVENNKQKDDIESVPIYLQPAENAVGSLVLEAGSAPESAANKGEADKAFMRRQDMLSVLGASDKGMTWEEWRLASGGIPKVSMSRRVKRLKEDSEIYYDNGRYFVTPATADLADMDDDD